MTAIIKNEREYRIEKANLRDAKDHITNLLEQGCSKDQSPHQFAFEIHRLFENWDTGRERVTFYQNLANGTQTCEPFFSLKHVPHLWIKARIARGMTQEELAQKLGIVPQNIQRQEKSDYAGVSFSRMAEIEELLDVAFCGRLYFSPRLHAVSQIMEALVILGASDVFVRECLAPATEGFVRLTADEFRPQDQNCLFAVCAEEVFGVSADRLLTKTPGDVSKTVNLKPSAHLHYISSLLSKAWSKKPPTADVDIWDWGQKMMAGNNIRANVTLVLETLIQRGKIYFPLHESLFDEQALTFCPSDAPRKTEFRFIRADADPATLIAESGVQALDGISPSLFWNLAMDHLSGFLSRGKITRFQTAMLESVLSFTCS